jgi:hypothetical protein
LIFFQELFADWQSRNQQPGFFLGLRPCQKSPLPPFIKLILTHKWGLDTRGKSCYVDYVDIILKSLLFFMSVIPAKAGIWVFPAGSGFPFSRE